MRGFSRVLLLLLPAGWIFAQVSDGKEAGSPNPGRLPRKSAPLVFPTGGSVYRMLKPENFDRCRREVLTLLSGKDEMPSPGVQTSFPVWGSLYAGLVDSGMKKVDGSADSSRVMRKVSSTGAVWGQVMRRVPVPVWPVVRT